MDEVLRMLEAGVLEDPARLELVAGELIRLAPEGVRHVACVMRLARWAIEGTGGGRAMVLVQSTVRLGDHSLLAPDLAIVRPRDYEALGRHPDRHDLLLVIEVGDSSARSDRRRKLATYAAAGVSELWLVDLPAGHVRVNRRPRPERRRYASVVSRRGGEVLEPEALPGLAISAGQILGSSPP